MNERRWQALQRPIASALRDLASAVEAGDAWGCHAACLVGAPLLQEVAWLLRDSPRAQEQQVYLLTRAVETFGQVATDAQRALWEILSR